jgi:glutamyl-Q tRNA(Asp) synthetase
LFAYQLAVVVDDAEQGVSDIVRGADLLESTPRQIFLQRLLGLPTPRYLHLPVVTNRAGEKLSKQTLAAPIDRARPSTELVKALAILRQHPPSGLVHSNPAEILERAIRQWDRGRLPRTRTIIAPD